MSKMIPKFRKDRDYSDDFNNSKKYYAAKKNNNDSSVDRKIKLRQYQENESYLATVMKSIQRKIITLAVEL